MLVFPKVRPEIVPSLTVAIEGVELTHIPLAVVFAKTIEEPYSTEDKPVILFTVGKAFTVVKIELDEAGLPIAQALLEVTVA